MSKLVMLNLLMFFLMIPYESQCFAALSDPTKPAYLQKRKMIQKSTIKKKPESLIVKSIILSNSSKIAIINNSIVTVGDKIGTALVIEINSNFVIVQSNRKRIVLPFGKVVVRESVKNNNLK